MKNCPVTVRPSLSRTDGVHWCGLSRMKRHTNAPWCAPVVRFIEGAVKTVSLRLDSSLSCWQKVPITFELHTVGYLVRQPQIFNMFPLGKQRKRAERLF